VWLCLVTGTVPLRILGTPENRQQANKISKTTPCKVAKCRFHSKLHPNPALYEETMPRSQFSRLSLCAAAIGAVALAAFAIAPSRAAEEAVIIPVPTVDAKEADGIQTAVLAGGCFWGVQGVFQHTAGVVNAVSGYSGGSKDTADYNLVSSGRTGHAEAVEVKYDPKKISYGKILQIFFSVVHDPTQLNRQGPDVGTQYRSAIFTANDEQKKVADAYIAQLNAAKVFKKPIATKIDKLDAFYAAEDYHQDYLTLHPNQPYIVFNDIPKVEALKKIFADNYIAKPTLVNKAKATN
jgi:peptide-methionine (S)-S-oxide reductase